MRTGKLAGSSFDRLPWIATALDPRCQCGMPCITDTGLARRRMDSEGTLSDRQFDKEWAALCKAQLHQVTTTLKCVGTRSLYAHSLR